VLKIAGYLCAKTHNFAQCLWITKPKNINPRTEWIHKIQTVYQSLEYCVDEIEHLVTEETKQKKKKNKKNLKKSWMGCTSSCTYYPSSLYLFKTKTRRAQSIQSLYTYIFHMYSASLVFNKIQNKRRDFLFWTRAIYSNLNRLGLNLPI
jgi:hypothetical protein